MEDRNISVVTTGKNDVILEDRRISKPGKYEVQVAMQRVGICGSDVHFMEHGRIGDWVVETSVVLGHEASGIVSEVGECVTTLQKGDKVALEPGIPCRKCKICKSGKYHLCKDVRFISLYPYDGMLRQHHNHPEDFCFKLPENVSLEEGALMEPLSVAIHACRRAGVQLGQNVLVLGAGPIGLANLLTTKAMGLLRSP